MFDLKIFENKIFYRGGFSAYSELNNQNVNYSHIFTNASMQQLLEEFPEMQIGMGECFDGFLEQRNKNYFFYFWDQLSEPVSFTNLRQIVKNEFSFNQQGYYYDEKKSIFLDALDIYKKEALIRPLYDEIERDHLLEAIVVSVLTQIPVKLESGVRISGEGSAFFFRKMFEELLSQGKLAAGFDILDEYGLLEDYLPELCALKGIEQDKDFHPEGDAWEHIKECLTYFSSRNVVLAWAVVLHDLGKAVAQTSRNRKFDKHAELGVPMARNILTRMRYSQEVISEILFLIENHMLPVFVPYMNDNEREKLIRHPLIKPLFQLFKIDILGSHKDLGQYKRIKNLLKKEQ